MDRLQAFAKARAVWPDRLVLVTTFANQCKLAWSRGGRSQEYYADTFEEAFRKASVA